MSTAVAEGAKETLERDHLSIVRQANPEAQEVVRLSVGLRDGRLSSGDAQGGQRPCGRMMDRRCIVRPQEGAMAE